MEALFLIAALVDGPFRGIVGIVLMLPIALVTFFLCRWLAPRHLDGATRCLRWAPILCALALVFALTMDFLRPVRNLHDTMIQSKLGKLSEQQSRAEIDRNYSDKGLLLRGLLHYGPITVIFFSALGLHMGSSGKRQQVTRF